MPISNEKYALAVELKRMSEILEMIGNSLLKGSSLSGLTEARLNQLRKSRTKAGLYYELVKIQETK